MNVNSEIGKCVSPTPLCDSLMCEIAWEVCQQVGGIYTVIRSKAAGMQERWGNNYVLIGPYNPELAPAEFEELPPEGVFGQAVEALRKQGMDVHYGRWLIMGQPRVILMDYRSVYKQLGEIKYLQWEHHGIGFPGGDALLDNVLAFGYMVENFFRALTALPDLPGPAVALMHEWMAGSCIGEMRRANLPVGIIFHTHATMLGRYLAMNDPWFYDHLPFVDWLGDAKRFNIEPQVRLERMAAHGAHLFTTLSDITAYECEYVVGRKPDLLLPNGLNIERFIAVHEFQNLHREYKQKLHEFVMGHFFPSYTFDLEKTLYFFTSGRYEYRNKGFDMTIESLARLNARMKARNIDRTIVFILLSRRPYKSVNAEVLQSRAQMEEMRKTAMAMTNQLGERLFMATAMGQQPRLDELADDYWQMRLKQIRHSWRIKKLPAIVTHDMVDDNHDEVLNQLRGCNLINRPEDKVKVIYHPEFVTSADPLFGMDYDQFVRACHLGIFPSYYEPWGYTPEECMARGIPAVTSDLSGFGTYLLKYMPDYESRGLFVVHRRMNSFDVAVEQLTQYLLDFVQMERRGRIALRNTVESCSDDFDWQNMIRNYTDAHMEVRKRTGR
ncbi:MAG: glycosyltransferase [Planctomycetaceae bacterium]|nr:MAG: glycosyltransferase [Planctomycetaceae bacterium]